MKKVYVGDYGVSIKNLPQDMGRGFSDNISGIAKRDAGQ
jgi:hypothetical protein